MSLLRRGEIPSDIISLPITRALAPSLPMIDVLAFQARSGISLPKIVGLIEEMTRHYIPIPVFLTAPQMTSERAIIVYSGPGLDYQVD